MVLTVAKFLGIWLVSCMNNVTIFQLSQGRRLWNKNAGPNTRYALSEEKTLSSFTVTKNSYGLFAL